VAFSYSQSSALVAVRMCRWQARPVRSRRKTGRQTRTRRGGILLCSPHAVLANGGVALRASHKVSMEVARVDPLTNLKISKLGLLITGAFVTTAAIFTPSSPQGLAVVAVTPVQAASVSCTVSVQDGPPDSHKPRRHSAVQSHTPYSPVAAQAEGGIPPCSRARSIRQRRRSTQSGSRSVDGSGTS